MLSLSISKLDGGLDVMRGSLSLRRRGFFSSERTTSTPRITIALTVVPSDAALLLRRRYFVSGMSTGVLMAWCYHIYGWVGGGGGGEGGRDVFRGGRGAKARKETRKEGNRRRT